MGAKVRRDISGNHVFVGQLGVGEGAVNFEVFGRRLDARPWRGRGSHLSTMEAWQLAKTGFSAIMAD